MENDFQRFSEALMQGMEIKGVNAEKLSQVTGISERYIEALMREQFDQLPPLPYVRGYVMRISELLQMNGTRLWELFLATSLPPKKSGKGDILPRNRFAIKGHTRVITWAAVAVGLVAAGYLVYAYFINSNAHGLELQLEDGLKTATTTLVIRGSFEPNDRLTLNDEEVYADTSGIFETSIKLQEGENTLTFKIFKILGREYTITRRVTYIPPESETQPPETAPPANNTTPEPETSSSEINNFTYGTE